MDASEHALESVIEELSIIIEIIDILKLNASK